jgi:hypothetical protein
LQVAKVLMYLRVAMSETLLARFIADAHTSIMP